VAVIGELAVAGSTPDPTNSRPSAKKMAAAARARLIRTMVCPLAGPRASCPA
jgi:hypothetical protein